MTAEIILANRVIPCDSFELHKGKLIKESNALKFLVSLCGCVYTAGIGGPVHGKVAWVGLQLREEEFALVGFPVVVKGPWGIWCVDATSWKYGWKQENKETLCLSLLPETHHFTLSKKYISLISVIYVDWEQTQEETHT